MFNDKMKLEIEIFDRFDRQILYHPTYQHLSFLAWLTLLANKYVQTIRNIDCLARKFGDKKLRGLPAPSELNK